MVFDTGPLLITANRVLNKSNCVDIVNTIKGRGQIFLVSYIGERPWWPIQSPNKGRKKKVKG